MTTHTDIKSRVKYLDFDPNLAHTRELLPAVTVERCGRVGKLLSDPAEQSGQSFQRSAYRTAWNISFPSIRLWEVNDVSIVNDICAVHDGKIIVNHLTLFDRDNPNSTSGGLSFLETSDAVEKATLLSAMHIEESPTLVVHNEGGGTWGHWLIQNLPKVALFFREFPDGKVALPAAYFTATRPSFGESLALFDISSDQVVRLWPGKIVHLRQAVFIDNLFKRSSAHPWVIDLFKSLRPTRNPRIKFFAARPALYRRGISNLEEVYSTISRSGFEHLETASLHLHEQREWWSNGASVAAVLGSDLSNMIFCSPTASLFVISPASHGDEFFFDLAASLGLEWNELVCHRVSEILTPTRASSFEVDVGILDGFLRQGAA